MRKTSAGASWTVLCRFYQRVTQFLSSETASVRSSCSHSDAQQNPTRSSGLQSSPRCRCSLFPHFTELISNYLGAAAHLIIILLSEFLSERTGAVHADVHVALKHLDTKLIRVAVKRLQTDGGRFCSLNVSGSEDAGSSSVVLVQLAAAGSEQQLL